MNLTPIILDAAAIGIGDSQSTRAEGLHASDLYGSYYMATEPDRYKGGTPEPLLLETGLIFEQMLEEGLKRRFANAKNTGEQIERPGEFTYRGSFDGYKVIVHYNPDLFIYNGVLRIGEIKATWLSSKIPHEWLASHESQEEHRADIIEALMNEKLAKYWTQLKFYCQMTCTNFGRLYVLFIAGDYSRPYRSQLVAVDVEFSQDELDSEYALLMYHGIQTGKITEVVS